MPWVSLCWWLGPGFCTSRSSWTTAPQTVWWWPRPLPSLLPPVQTSPRGIPKMKKIYNNFITTGTVVHTFSCHNVVSTSISSISKKVRILLKIKRNLCSWKLHLSTSKLSKLTHIIVCWELLIFACQRFNKGPLNKLLTSCKLFLQTDRSPGFRTGNRFFSSTNTV